MTLEFVIRNWSLVIGSVLGTAVALFLAHRAFSDSARGQLRSHRRMLTRRYRAADRADATVAKAAKRLEKLQSKLASVKPRHLQEAAEALEDARSLLKIAHDQVLIAENQVRKLIVEEYPPKRHDAMRSRYLRPAEDRDRPFSF